jgi:hypothetical protein
MRRSGFGVLKLASALRAKKLASKGRHYVFVLGNGFGKTSNIERRTSNIEV